MGDALCGPHSGWYKCQDNCRSKFVGTYFGWDWNFQWSQNPNTFPQISFTISNQQVWLKMGNPQRKRPAPEPPSKYSPTKKQDTKDPNKKSAEDSPSKTQTPGTPSSNNTVKLPETPQPMAPTTPKTPASAKLLGMKKATGTMVRNHATASNPSLYRMLEGLMDRVMEKQPQSIDERKGLLDALAEQLVNTGLFGFWLLGSKVTRKENIFNAYQVRVGPCVRGNSIKLQRSNPLLNDQETFGWNSRASTTLPPAARNRKIGQCLRCVGLFFYCANM